MDNSSDLDLIGVGFGPAGIALGAAIADFRAERASPAFGSVKFFERQKDSAWHGNFLLPGTDLNNHVYRDLATPRDPRSYFTFANYLKLHGRLYDFGLLGRPASRHEWADYIQWAAQELSPLVAYDEPVIGIRPVQRANSIHAFSVETVKGTYTARRIVLSTGAKPRIPPEYAPLQGAHVFHTSDFLPRIAALHGTQPRFMVVGSGQSAGEALIELRKTFPRSMLYSVHRSIGFKLYDLGHFSNQVYSPPETDYYYNLPSSAKRTCFEDLRATNYSGLDMTGSSELYSMVYEDRVSGREFIKMLTRRKLVSIDGGNGCYRVVLEDIYTGATDSIEIDVVILATGYYLETFPALLSPLRQYIELDAEGVPLVERDFRVKTKNDCHAEIYVNGLCERSHGISDSQSFSLLAVRSETILKTIVASAQRERGRSAPPRSDPQSAPMLGAMESQS